jgi:Spy/CpxP family protein refolding chaperone
MQKTLCSLALSGVLAVAGSAAFAQSDSSPQQPAAPATNAQPMQGHRGMDPDKQVAELSKRLSLTADQQTQIKPILVARQQQMEALHQDQTASQQDKMAKMKSLRDDSNAKIEAVLTDTQKQKFEKMQAKQQERWQQRQQGGTAATNSPS